ncbi:MAG: hypothetical protein H7Z10_04415 [Gemmatimonadaceae bacterium]|nr:hypothetical protein [Acetobacteraceae bacterium]
MRLHQMLIAFSVLVPALLFAGATWQNYKEVMREGRETISRTTAIMHEHARKVFETEELMLGLVNERVGNRDWAAVEGQTTNQFLRQLMEPLEQAISVWVADENGTIRAGSQNWEPGSGISDRDFFTIHRDSVIGTYVSEIFVGRATQLASFAISRRRSTPDGEFGGTIHVGASPEYFARFYADASPSYAHFALLLRTDGAILARSPQVSGGPNSLPPTGPLMRRMAAQPIRGSMQMRLAFDGIDRLYEYRRVGAYPVYVVFGVEPNVILKPWRENVRVYGLVAGAAALTLLLVSWLALRRALSEQNALMRLRQENTQRLAAEEQLRHSQRMDAVGQLTGGVAHDFNNLLTAILGNLELIQRASAENRPETERRDAHAKITRLADTAIKAVQRGTTLTRSLLAFSRTQPLQTEAVDTNALLRDFADLVRQAMGVTIDVDVVLADDLPRCQADAAQLEAAILNMAINARHAMPHGGRLRIETGLADLNAPDLAGNTEAQPGRFIRISVADTGQGMPPEVAAKAFEPFFTTKPIGQGTGLGLSQVFGFVRQLGGHVTLRSTLNEGTCIELFLPVAS